MSRHVPDEQLEAIHTELRTLTRKAESPVIAYGITSWGEQRQLIGVDLRDISCALDELRQRRRRDGKFGAKPIGPTAQALMAMKVGDFIDLPPTSVGALSTARKTARKHMDDTTAVWHSHTLETGQRRVTRMPAGTPPCADYSNPAVQLMADMAVGDVIVLKKAMVKGKMYNGLKVQARQVMQLPTAQWRCENLASGNIRCWRTR